MSKTKDETAHYWSEPYKTKFVYNIDKVEKGTGKVLQNTKYPDKLKADDFLKTIHVYIDDKLMYSGQ